MRDKESFNKECNPYKELEVVYKLPEMHWPRVLLMASMQHIKKKRTLFVRLLLVSTIMWFLIGLFLVISLSNFLYRSTD